VVVTFGTAIALPPGNYFVSLFGPASINWGYTNALSGAVPSAVRTSNWSSIPMTVRFLTKIIGGTLDPLPFTDAPIPGLMGVRAATLFSGAINDSSTVANRVRLGGVGVSKTNDLAILRTGFTSGIVARTGELAGAGEAVFSSLGDPVLNNKGQVAFTGTLRGSGVTTRNDQGLWSDLGGSLVPVIREGDSVPALGSGAVFQKINWFHLGDTALFIGATAREGAAKRSGVWKWDGTTLANITYIGDSFALGGQDRVIKTISGPLSIGTGNAQSRIGSSSGRLLLLLTAQDGWQEFVRFQ
jgi:hypothetical protein